MSDIKLISEEYTSRFVTGPELQTELSKKQDDVGFYINSGGNVAVDCGISQNDLMSENWFGGITRFGTIEIQGQRPVLDISSSDGSITVTRDTDRDSFDLKAHGGSKWITDEYDDRTILNLGKDEHGNTDCSIFVCGPIYLSSDDADGTCSIKHRIWPMGVGIEIETGSTDTGESAVIDMRAESAAYIVLKINNRTCELYEDDLRKLREILDAHS